VVVVVGSSVVEDVEAWVVVVVDVDAWVVSVVSVDAGEEVVDAALPSLPPQPEAKTKTIEIVAMMPGFLMGRSLIDKP
jgi:hypothetical protein